MQAENRLHGLSEFLWNVNVSLEAAVPSPHVFVLPQFDVKRFTEIAASPLEHNTVPGRGGFDNLECVLPSKLLHLSQFVGMGAVTHRKLFAREIVAFAGKQRCQGLVRV
jgi:hypothetical protein